MGDRWRACSTSADQECELWIRAHRGLGKIPVVLTLLGLSNFLQCTTKSSNFPLWGEKVVFLTSWGELVISRRGVPTEMLPPNPGVLIHNWRDQEYANYGLRARNGLGNISIRTPLLGASNLPQYIMNANYG